MIHFNLSVVSSHVRYHMRVPAMMRLFVAFLLITSTGGCTSRMITERDDAYCKAQGKEPGSKAYFQCRLKQAVN